MLLFRSNNLSNGHIGLGSDSFYIASASNAPLVFCTNSDGGVSGTSTPTNERMRLDSSGRLGLGTTGPVNGGATLLTIRQTGGDLSSTTVTRANAQGITVSDPASPTGNYGNGIWFDSGALLAGIASTRITTSNWGTDLRFYTHPTATSNLDNVYERVRIDSEGRVGIGSTAPNYELQINASDAVSVIQLTNTSTGATASDGLLIYNNGVNAFISNEESGFLKFQTAGAERAQIDASGRLLVGTSTHSGLNVTSYTGLNAYFANTGDTGISLSRFQNTTNGPSVQLLKSRGTSVGSLTTVSSGDSLGEVVFAGADGDEFRAGASIVAIVDGTPGNNDMPGRLVFSTTADGASSPTERMRISQNGFIDMPGVYNFTTANAANVNVDATGGMRRSTSSKKYKTDIETLQDSYADALLNCRPVWYRSTCEADCPEHSYWGFIAEEVAAIDPRLVHWKTIDITYGESGSVIETPCEPEPEGVAYDRFVPHLLNLIKRQKEQIEAMEARLSALEAS
jgi:hypothetical protein